MRAKSLACIVLILFGPYLFGQTYAQSLPDLAHLWRLVENAASSQEQEEALANFLTAAAAQSSEPFSYMLTATSVNGERPVPIGDKALLDEPFAHRLNLFVGGKTYGFRPRSPQVISLLLRE